MCTVSWHFEAGGYQLFCNRDERLTRPAATPPDVIIRNGVSFVAPLDGEHGGTWIAVNEFGVSVCLLNGYDAAVAHSVPRISRGLLVLDLIEAATAEDARRRMSSTALDAFAPFTLCVLERGSSAIVVRWDGRRLAVEPDAGRLLPLVSSSFDVEGASAHRRALLRRLQNDCRGSAAGLMLAFHRSHEPQAGPHSPCMHRADAATVSFTRISVSSETANLYYEAGPPCRSLAGESVDLKLNVSCPG